ncbi:DUF4270 family protein [Algoriphagus sp.]|uniref:DUF4270 family protein n=1 Tax=Algoriphagus sp. TaxID=1872435 RepID=UPI00391AA484
MMSFSASIIALPGKLAISAFLSILLISSCSDPATVGLELAPGNNQIGVFYKDFNLNAQVVLLDSFNTVNSGLLIVGNEEDEFFGKTESIGYSRMFFDGAAEKPLASAILDSMFFNMEVVSVNGSNLDRPKRYTVHRLTEPLLDTLYYNFDALSFEENPFASINFTFNEEKDTILRLPIIKEFQEEFFGKLKVGRASEFENLFTFRQYFPGFAIKSRTGDNTTIGVDLGGNTGIAVFYHYEGDTVSKRFNVNTFSSRSFNGIKSNRTGTPTGVVTESGKSYDVGSIVGMKSTLAMAIRVDTSPIDAFLDTLSGVIFNQVVLSIGEIESQDVNNNPITGMVMVYVNRENKPLTSSINGAPLYVQTDGQPQVIFDQNGNKVPNNIFLSAAILSYDPATKKFQTRITSHVNAIFRGQLQRQDWLLYGNTPQTERDDFKRSLRQFKVNQNKINVQVIYSKSR